MNPRSVLAAGPVVLALGLAGCGLGLGDRPLPGVWTYKGGGTVSSTCPPDLYRDPDATFLVEDVTGEGFTIHEAERFACTLAGSTFVCPERRRIEVPVGDTTLAWTVRVDGVVRSARHLSGEQTFTVSCTGGLCELDRAVLKVDLPCSYVVSFEATKD